MKIMNKEKRIANGEKLLRKLTIPSGIKENSRNHPRYPAADCKNKNKQNGSATSVQYSQWRTNYTNNGSEESHLCD